MFSDRVVERHPWRSTTILQRDTDPGDHRTTIVEMFEGLDDVESFLSAHESVDAEQDARIQQMNTVLREVAKELTRLEKARSAINFEFGDQSYEPFAVVESSFAMLRDGQEPTCSAIRSSK
jgi:hypothetical protein